MKVLFGAIVAAAALVASACGSTDEGVASTEAASATDSGSSSESGSDAANTADGPVLGADVLTGQATTISGENFDLGSLADKDLVVWFWAPW